MAGKKDTTSTTELKRKRLSQYINNDEGYKATSEQLLLRQEKKEMRRTKLKTEERVSAQKFMEIWTGVKYGENSLDLVALEFQKHFAVFRKDAIAEGRYDNSDLGKITRWCRARYSTLTSKGAVLPPHKGSDRRGSRRDEETEKAIAENNKALAEKHSNAEWYDAALRQRDESVKIRKKRRTKR